MKTNTTISQYIFNSIGSTQVVVGDREISVREADKAAQALRKAHLATLAQ